MDTPYRSPDLPRFRWPWLSSSFLHVEPAWAGLFRQAGLGSVRDIMTTTRGRVVSWDRKREKNDVLLVELERDGEPVRFFIKRYYTFQWQKILRRAFRGNLLPPSMVRKEFDNLKRLGRLGFDVPEMIGYGEERYAGGLVLAVLISREIPNAVGLDALARESWTAPGPDPRRPARHRLMESLAEVTRRMHEAGFEHHDYFFRNLMVRRDDATRVHILDCPRGMRWPRFLMSWRCLHDLATLDAASGAMFSRTDRLRFFLRYRGQTRLSAPDRKLIRRILRRAEPMRQRQVQRLSQALVLDQDKPRMVFG